MRPLLKAATLGKGTQSSKHSNTSYANSVSSIRAYFAVSMAPIVYLRAETLLAHRSTSPVQKIITTSKGVSIDLDSLSRDSKAQSKELYTWGQTEDEDIKDGAVYSFVSGTSDTY
jgi:hypothetical protein